MHTNKRWLYLALGVFSMLFAGIIYAWSILKAPFGPAFSWSADDLALNFTFTMCFFCLGGLAGARLTKAMGTRLTMVIAALLGVGGFILTSRLNGSSVWWLYGGYSLLAGTGIGIAYNVVVSTVSQWFPDKKGLCTGFLMMGFGSSALILGNIASLLMENPGIGWRTTYLILGIALGLVLLLAGLLLRKPETAGAASGAGEESDLTTGQMLRTGSFWLAFFCIIGLLAVGSSVISFARDLALSVGATAGLATTLVGVLSVFNGLGRILTGSLFDKIGQRKTMLLANVVSIAAAGVILLAVWLGSLPLCIGGLCLTGISYGACPTISSAFTASYFGVRHFGGNLAVMNLNLMLGSFIATLSSTLMTRSGGYMAPFLMLLGLGAVALVLNLRIPKPKK